MNIEAIDSNTIAERLIFDLTTAFALADTEFARSFVRLIFGKTARAAAEVAVDIDCAVAEGGAAAGARKTLLRFVKSHEARGIENVPPYGPLIVASNHPASIDSFVITAHINRPDYKVIIGDIPFLENMPHIREHAIFAPEDKDMIGRMR